MFVHQRIILERLVRALKIGFSGCPNGTGDFSIRGGNVGSPDSAALHPGYKTFHRPRRKVRSVLNRFILGASCGFAALASLRLKETVSSD